MHSTLKSKPTTDRQNVFQSAYEPRVHIVKTHFPERKGWKTVNAKRALLLVRNPYDAIDSYWNLCCTNTHTRSLDESVYKQYVDKFESLARHEITVWCEFHYHWLDVCEKEGVPLLIMRYEDLVLDTDGEMKRLLKFLMDMEKDDTNAEVSDVHMGDLKKGFGVGNNLSDFWDWRISHAIGNATTNAKAAQSKTSDTNSTNTSRLGSYQPRSSGGGLLSIGKTLRKHRYSESVLLHMHDVAVSLAIARKEKLSKKKLGPTAPWGKISNILNSSANPSLLPHKKQQYNMTLLQMFGYDVYSQNFPENILKPLQVSLDELTNSFKRIPSQQGLVEINNTTEIRKKDDPYGRAMTAWRRGETNGDTTPFATVAR